MATPPKATNETTTSKSAKADPQKVDFNMDPEVKRQLDAGGSYKPTAEKTAEYIPPGPGPLAEGAGGSSGGLAPETTPASTEKK